MIPDENLMKAIDLRKDICYLQGRLDGLESLSSALRDELDDKETLLGIWIMEENLASLIHVEIEDRESKIKELIGEDES